MHKISRSNLYEQSVARREVDLCPLPQTYRGTGAAGRLLWVVGGFAVAVACAAFRRRRIGSRLKQDLERLHKVFSALAKSLQS